MMYLTDCNWMKKPYLDSKENHHPTTPSLFKQTANNILKIRNSIIFTILFVAFAGGCWGQSAGDYRSKVPEGNWNSISSWETCTVGANPGPVAWGGVPTVVPTGSTKMITIQSKHTITIPEDKYIFIKSLTIESGGVLIIAPGGYLSSNSTSTITLGGVLIIAPGSYLNSDGAITLGGTESLVLQSNANQTGSCTFNSLIGGGSVKVERFMSDNYWHLYCSPISNQSVHNFLKNNINIPELNDGSHKVAMCDYNTASDEWKSYFTYVDLNLNNLTDLMDSCKGFSIMTMPDLIDPIKNGIVYASGTPYSNNVNITLTRTDKAPDKGWNCIGNPFLCAINLSDNLTDTCFLVKNFSSIDHTSSDAYFAAYIWDSKLSEYKALNYATSLQSVQVGQGFFIKASDNKVPVFFRKSQQLNGYALDLPFKAAKLKWPSISLIIQHQTLKSETQISFVTNTTKGIDPGYDAGILKATKDLALYTRLMEDIGVDFCMQSLPDQNYDQYVIPIGIDFKAGGDITFTAETINLPSGCQALLEDRLTKQFTRLDLKDAKYTATVSANTKGIGRFFLHTSDVISSVQPIENEPFKVNTVGTTVYINGEVSEKANFVVYSMNGKQLANFRAESQVQNQFNASGFPAGVYILTCDDQNQKKSTKFVIEN